MVFETIRRGCRSGKLHLVYTPMPHVIVSADGSGSSEKIYSTSFGPLRKVVQEFPHVRTDIPKASTNKENQRCVCVCFERRKGDLATKGVNPQLN